MSVAEDDLYARLSIQRDASAAAIKRAWRSAASKLHPDKKHGDASAFAAAQHAYHVLSDADRRRRYDSTGDASTEPTAVEAFARSFGFSSEPHQAAAPPASVVPRRPSVEDRIILPNSSTHADAASHTAGFQAWLRSRAGGDGVFTAETAAQQFGVVQGTYQPVAVTPRDDLAVEVVCSAAGEPSAALAVQASQLPPTLEWGCVAVEIKLAPINPADLYSARLGGIYGDASTEPPYIAGHEGVGIVSQVGPGVTQLEPGDVVLPMAAFMGTWRGLAVWQERDVMRVRDVDGLSLEYLAVAKELCLAYALLEQHGSLQPGDCVILNAANSTVGQAVLQLCKLLGLRAVAVARDTPPGAASTWQRLSDYLQQLGATVVVKEEAAIKVELSKRRFFARPKLALDAVGGDSGLKLAEALADGGELVVYGCMSGKPPSLPWHSYVFRGLHVTGFNLRKWLSTAAPSSDAMGGATTPGNMAAAAAKVTSMLRSVGKLVAANLLELNFTEYDMSTELGEALEHALDRGKNTKVLLRTNASRGSGAAAVSRMAPGDKQVDRTTPTVAATAVSASA